MQRERDGDGKMMNERLQKLTLCSFHLMMVVRWVKVFGLSKESLAAGPFARENRSKKKQQALRQRRSRALNAVAVSVCRPELGGSFKRGDSSTTIREEVINSGDRLCNRDF
ncbi:hypothetical protein CDAR_38901 [Caerostris darwini]|uniref:Uncharacterized protein n=1 Tax=Caerostris darwini TaxID=1538125 RepID=A0AAV4UQG3_9ARAC|nr:hypothetical protein CDAR_38901 [Caerostris darwini]